jgi:DNA-directed RNA polymerase subunit RPC12/RpoP
MTDKPRCLNCDRPEASPRARYAIALDCGATVEITVAGGVICRRCPPRIISQYFREEVNRKSQLKKGNL